MNLKGAILALLGITSAANSSESFTPLTKSQALQYTNDLNNWRRALKPTAADMHLIRYNFDAQHKLDAIVEAKGGRWFFEVNPNPPFQFRQNMNGYFASEEIGFNKEFYGWHDTCSKLGQNCIFINFKFRTHQLDKCFDYNNCNPDNYNRFKSCNTALNQTGSGHPCSYAWVYLPLFMTANISEIACAVLNVKGWSPPPGQLNSYWCYTNGKAPSNDLPYIAGKTCSECKPQEKCKNKLCL